MSDLERLTEAIGRDLGEYQAAMRAARVEFAHVEIRPSQTLDGSAAINAFVDGKLLGAVRTDDEGRVSIILTKRNFRKPKS